MTTWSRRRFLGGAAALGALGAGAAACGGLDSGGSSGSDAANAAGSAPAVSVGGSTASPGAVSASPSPSPGTVDPAMIAQKYKGLKPFPAAPPAPAVKPINLDVAKPPVISRVPTNDKIVFLTIDDGIEKDPRFVQMVKDFRIPFTLFLTDQMIRDDYGYFTQLLDTGMVTIQNHTLTHPDMPEHAASRQLDEVSGQQQKLIREYGTAPYLFRPPYGNYNSGTFEAVEQTPGLKALVVWKESMQIDDMQYQGAHVLHPGDIILSHFRGPSLLKGETMIGMMENLFKHIQQQGFTIAKLTDYV
jgi:peptidoglycan/xylan/chitin deacetylase (PgdA/CDA1 family)